MLIESTYKSPFPVNNGHVETVVPYFLRQVTPLKYQRERIETDDHDFLDIDWVKKKNTRLAILSHGLEGCSHSKYIMGLGHKLLEHGFDILAWNNRGCSGETNKLIKMYHSGASYDLRTVIDHALLTTGYPEIYLVGFSMGGNITLKYLGEESKNLSPRIKKAIVFSTPISLEDSADALSSGISLFYSRHFIRQITKKLVVKNKKFDDFNPDIKKINRMWNFQDLDDAVTAPINGFKNAREYWDKSSSLHFINDIKVKTLIINAKNDPFLKGRCFPYELLRNHSLVDFETPERGGHVGFVTKGLSDFWFENRTVEYFS